MIAVIIPDRGDRPLFTEHCLYQIKRQTVKPQKIYHINTPPVDDNVDIVPRIRRGVRLAIEDGMDRAVIIENDDYYPDTYIENISWSDFSGISYYTYYNVFTGKWKSMYDPGHSPLYCTAFNLSKMDLFEWTADNERNLDKYIWIHAKKFSRTFYRPDELPIGIKHGTGKLGGQFHFKIHTMNEDLDINLIRRKQSRDFYLSLKGRNGPV